MPAPEMATVRADAPTEPELPKVPPSEVPRFEFFTTNNLAHRCVYPKSLDKYEDRHDLKRGDVLCFINRDSGYPELWLLANRWLLLGTKIAQEDFLNGCEFFYRPHKLGWHLYRFHADGQKYRLLADSHD